MNPTLVFLVAVATYLGVGGVFALVFVFAGVGRIDAAAKSAGVGFRLLIVPGAAALWPVMLWRWMRGPVAAKEAKARRLRGAHLAMWSVLGPALLAGLAAVLWMGRGPGAGP